MKKPNPEHVERIKQMVGAAPFPSHMKMTLTELEVDACMVEIGLERCHLQPYGIVHGGVIATLLDTATFWAAYLRIPEDSGMVNVDLKLNYLAAVREGRLRCEGRCVRPGKTISYCEAWVRGPDDTLIAHGTSSLLALPGKGLGADAPKFLND